ncbi:MAG: galactokinase [Clostridiales bacterium]|jgi:galactokinase|nr:galactokinase [Clostridiales bacterium]
MDRVSLFLQAFGACPGEPVRHFSAGGRVNIIGEHIDYNGGNVFPAALGLRCHVYCRRNGMAAMRLAFTTTQARGEIDYADLCAYKTTPYINYQAGVCSVLRGAGIPLVGVDVLYDVEVPFGSGLSSSAAIEVATAFMLRTLAAEDGGPPPDRVSIALLARKAENEYVGVNCGIMDQYASACGRRGYAMRLDCASLECEYVPLELGDYTLVLIDTCTPHSLVTSKYNERRGECEAALAALKRELPAVNALCEIPPAVFEAHAHLLPPVLAARARHCVNEQARVRAAVAAMKAGDIGGLGALLNQSHASLRDLYRVSCVQLDAVADAAQAHPACVGCRMTGAGFGGSCVAVVKKDAVADFIAAVQKEYRARTDIECKIYQTTIADGVKEEK